ncbi:MAG: glycine--tRNA ligase subunit beta [Deferribacterales bacterium]|nr:glycine--tRNA ligase subunit beta [Deferribacterales bacterium]
MSFYLLEIGCEEIPAAFVPQSTTYLKNEFEKQLAAYSLPAEEIISGGTPRRLYVYIRGLSQRQEDKTEIVTGPPAKIAFTEKGELTPVGLKFAESKGLDITTVKKVSLPKGEYLQGEKKTGGSHSSDVLKAIVPTVISGIPFAKSMRWGNGDFRFARPVHWFLSILSGDILPFEIDGIKASDYTFGHRFLAPAKITVKDFETYKSSLKNAFVIVDENQRKEMIKEQAAALEQQHGFKIQLDEELLSVTANLTEYPHCVTGSFDQEFLGLPKEVLITSMKVHQKYFPIDLSGNLTNKFMGVSNMVTADNDNLIRQGYERVLRARLNDADFFFKNDRLVPLEERAQALKKVVYQEKLGTSYEKVQRFTRIAVKLAQQLAAEKVEAVKTASMLAKADLMSEMVYEFPELQGVMGSYYAQLEGKPEEISKAIFEHYLPRFAGDILPETQCGRLISIADKLDTIAGAFASGMIPTGNLDPYGLRRGAIGILSIIENAGFRIDLRELIEFSLIPLQEKVKFDKDETAEKMLSFIMQRRKQMLTSRGVVDGEIFDAVLGKFSDPIALTNLAAILTKAQNSENFRIIAASFKRINNILKKDSSSEETYSAALLQTEEEKALSSLIENQNISTLINREKNNEALDELLKFAPAVNAFFDKVMVMAEDEAVRKNRLGLIASLRKVFISVCDFGAITLKDK